MSLPHLTSEGAHARCPHRRGSRRSAHFQRAMMMNVDQAAKAMRDGEMLMEIEDALEAQELRP